MKLQDILAIIFAAIVIAARIRRFLKSSGTRRQSQDNHTTPQKLEDKLSLLSDCGLKLAEPFTVDDLLASFDREEYEESGWDAVLTGLGIEDEIKGGWHCVNLWSFDTECIEDHGDYAAIVRRAAEMTQGSLPLQSIKDYVDIDNNEAWFSFTLNGEETRVECEVENDWVDAKIFSMFPRLLEKTDPSKIYIYRDAGGQCCYLGCVTKDQLKMLNANGIKFEALK